MSRPPNITRAARRIRDDYELSLTAGKSIARALSELGLIDQWPEQLILRAVFIARTQGGKITYEQARESLTDGMIGDGPHPLLYGRGGTGKSFAGSSAEQLHPRFSLLQFDSYGPEEMWQILVRIAEEDRRAVDPSAEPVFKAIIDEMLIPGANSVTDLKVAGNARFARNVYTQAKFLHEDQGGDRHDPVRAKCVIEAAQRIRYSLTHESINVHSVEIRPDGTLLFSCSAKPGAPCREVCANGCEEYHSEDCDRSVIDGGDCNALVWLNGGMDTALSSYAGESHVREGYPDGWVSGPIDTWWDNFHELWLWRFARDEGHRPSLEADIDEEKAQRALRRPKPSDAARHTAALWRCNSNSEPHFLLGGSGGVAASVSGGLLVTGANGSGKTELLRHALLTLAANHGPDQVRLIVGSAKRSALASQLAELPHTVATYTDLGMNASRVAELVAHLSQEIESRKRMSAVERASAPRIVVVIDDYPTVGSIHPDLIRALAAASPATSRHKWGISLAVTLLNARDDSDLAAAPHVLRARTRVHLGDVHEGDPEFSDRMPRDIHGPHAGLIRWSSSPAADGWVASAAREMSPRIFTDSDVLDEIDVIRSAVGVRVDGAVVERTSYEIPPLPTASGSEHAVVHETVSGGVLVGTVRVPNGEDFPTVSAAGKAERGKVVLFTAGDEHKVYSSIAGFDTSRAHAELEGSGERRRDREEVLWRLAAEAIGGAG